MMPLIHPQACGELFSSPVASEYSLGTSFGMPESVHMQINNIEYTEAIRTCAAQTNASL